MKANLSKITLASVVPVMLAVCGQASAQEVQHETKSQTKSETGAERVVITSDDGQTYKVVISGQPSADGAGEFFITEGVPSAPRSAIRGFRLSPDAEVQPEVRSRTSIVQQDGDREIKIEINGDDVKAWVDGERVAKNRIRVGDDAITILGPDGQTLHTFTRGMRFSLPAEGSPRDPIVWQGGDAPAAFMLQPEGEHPPVMIGINMGSVDSAVAEEIGIGVEDGIGVMSVIDGLPADQAGLRDGDVIIEIDGESPVNPSVLREILMAKEPGDSLEMVIVRRGKQREVELELAPYDMRRLSPEGIATLAPSVPNAFGWRTDDGAANQELHEMLERLRAQQGSMDESTRRDLEEMLQNLQRLEPLRELQLDRLPRFRAAPQVEGGLLLEAPAAPGRVERDLREQDERLSRIEARLERLEGSIERLIKAIEERDHN